MHALALMGLLALCATGWALPALNPLLERNQRLKRDLEGGESLKSTFDIIAEANENVVQQPGKYFVIDLDTVRSTKRIAGMCSSGTCTWRKNPDGNVYIPYTQAKDYTRYHNIVFLTAFREFASATCIRFVPRTNETDYITFESGSGCWSPIGRMGNQQFVSIAKSSCMVTGVIAHQLMHSLGFHHEHVRKDRDNYVSVQWDNILSGHEYEFEMDDTNNIKYTPYDYGSILHYGKKAYSKDGVSQTLIPVPDSSVNIGQTFAMSDVDIQKINLLYHCDRYLENSKSNLASSQYITSAKTTTTTTPTTTTPTTTGTPSTTMKTTTTTTAATTTTPTLATSTTVKAPTALMKIITSTPTTTTKTTETTTTKATTTPTTLGTTTTVSNDRDRYLENSKSNLASSQYITSAKTTTTTTPTTTTPTTTGTPSTTMKTTTTTTAATTTTPTLATSTTVKAPTALMKIITSTPTTTTKTTETTTTKATTTPTTLGTTTTVSNDRACGGTLTAKSGEITTPYYPEQYPRSTQCTWIIRATKLVNITFVDFELESGMNCMFDFMKFDDLSEIPVYIPKSKYCGTVAPNTWVSFRSSVQIIFSSDRTVQMRGFKLRYTAE
ncbi:zinc metalloproteinase nas-14-like [Pleurodeles waltl]|uniref:zinc metalloproteinase nas-14-like n=1 Tax=Pleurodeles waltl TaxID=8319 RepID=UPI003709B9FE